jgi:probable HAF family extracellular repeat protein
MREKFSRRESVRVFRFLLITVCLSAYSRSARAAVPSFQGLGDLPGGNFGSLAHDVSADGTTAVGQSVSSNGTEAFRWTRDTGIVGLGDLPGGTFGSEAHGVNADGSIIAGLGRPNTQDHAVRWTAGGIEQLESQLRGNLSSVNKAFAISADGSTIGGWMEHSGGTREATLWTNSGTVGLGFTSAGSRFSEVYCLDADGSAAAGRASIPGAFRAFRWTVSDGMQNLGDFAGGESYSEANGISADGSVVVGRGGATAGTEAFRWTAAEGMVPLGDLPGGNHHSVAYSTSADGSVIVGYSSSDSDLSAFVWDEVRGMRKLEDVLELELGLNLPGWNLITATAVSADGETIVGWGTNSAGRTEGWIATIPEPSVATAAMSICTLFLMGHCRSKGSCRMCCCTSIEYNV